MSFTLSWRAFERYLADRATSAHTTLGDDAAGDSEARLYIWRRFRRCHGAPVPPRSLYPIPVTCEPAVFNDADHWDAWYRRLVKLRNRDVAFVHDTNLFAPHDYRDPDDDPWTRVEGTGAGVEDQAVTDDEIERLRYAIESSFDTAVPYGPEIREAMLEVVVDLTAGATLEFVSAVSETLAARLPTMLGPDPTGRKRRQRVLDKRVRPWLHTYALTA